MHNSSQAITAQIPYDFYGGKYCTGAVVTVLEYVLATALKQLLPKYHMIFMEASIARAQ
jgi:hypothetical protein